jgi:hypothetical protein
MSMKAPNAFSKSTASGKGGHRACVFREKSRTMRSTLIIDCVSMVRDTIIMKMGKLYECKSNIVIASESEAICFFKKYADGLNELIASSCSLRLKLSIRFSDSQ